MKSTLLRSSLKLKRLAGHSVGLASPRITYLLRDEAPINIRNEFLSRYSEKCVVESIDPRNNALLGHYFNIRSTYLLDEVILEPVQGLVYDLNGSLLAESTVWPLFQLYSSFPWKPSNIRETVDVGQVILVTSNAYGHWLAEDLGSIVHLITNYPSATLLVSKNAPKYVKDFIEIADKNVIELDGPVRIKNLLFVSKSQDSGWMHPRDVEEIRNFPHFSEMLKIDTGPHSVYASRRNTKRSPKNEILIEKEFQSNGFTVIALEELNLLDEIKLMAGVRNFAGVHGSAHVNSIFMPQGAKLLDIVNENYWTELGPRIASIREQTYIPLLFSGTPNDSVDLEIIRKGIGYLEINQ